MGEGAQPPDDLIRGGGTSPEAVSAAERQLAVKLPADYQEFLADYGRSFG